MRDSPLAGAMLTGGARGARRSRAARVTIEVAHGSHASRTRRARVAHARGPAMDVIEMPSRPWIARHGRPAIKSDDALLMPPDGWRWHWAAFAGQSLSAAVGCRDAWLIRFHVLVDASCVVRSVSGTCDADASWSTNWSLTRQRGVNMYAHPDDWDATMHRPPADWALVVLDVEPLPGNTTSVVLLNVYHDLADRVVRDDPLACAMLTSGLRWQGLRRAWCEALGGGGTEVMSAAARHSATKCMADP